MKPSTLIIILVVLIFLLKKRPAPAPAAPVVNNPDTRISPLIISELERRIIDLESSRPNSNQDSPLA